MSKGIPDPLIWDLTDPNTLHLILLAFGNGIIVEMRAEGDSEEALEALRDIAKGVGNCLPVTLSADESGRLWLYRKGDECYRQGDKSPGYVFINPVPDPLLV